MSTRPIHFCWLIERGQAAGFDTPSWWRDNMKGGEWTIDPHEATKFETEARAKAVAHLMVGFAYRVVEHGFVGAIT